MKIKSGVWYWLAVASGAVGLLYGMGLEGSFQTGGTVSDAGFTTAMVLILLAVFFARLGFAAHDREQQERRKVHRQPRNTVKSGRLAGWMGPSYRPTNSTASLLNRTYRGRQLYGPILCYGWNGNNIQPMSKDVQAEMLDRLKDMEVRV